MKRDRKVVISMIWLVIGIPLMILGLMEVVDEFWNGMGFSLAIIGTLQLLKNHRFQKNEVYREKVEIAENDERNHFIRGKAWAWSGYLFIIISGVLSIVFKVTGQELLCLASCYAVCLIMVLYWISYIVLKRKY